MTTSIKTAIQSLLAIRGLTAEPISIKAQDELDEAAKLSDMLSTTISMLSSLQHKLYIELNRVHHAKLSEQSKPACKPTSNRITAAPAIILDFSTAETALAAERRAITLFINMVRSAPQVDTSEVIKMLDSHGYRIQAKSGKYRKLRVLDTDAVILKLSKASGVPMIVSKNTISLSIPEASDAHQGVDLDGIM